MIALSGVRISWLTLARNSDFAVEAFSAARLALSRSSCDFFQAVMSRMSAQNFGSCSPMRPIVMCSEINPPRCNLPITSRPSLKRFRRARARQPVEAVAHDARAVGCEQVEEGRAGERARLSAENRADAGIGLQDGTGAVDDQDAVGCDIEDAFEFGEFGFGGLDRRGRLCVLGRRNQHERHRGRAVIGNCEQPRIDRGALAGRIGDAQRLPARRFRRCPRASR